MTDDPITRSDLLLSRGAVQEAVSLVVQAAATHPDACFRLATWTLVGSPVPRNLPEARRLLAMARAAGHIDAALLEVALTANGSGAPADWSKARTLLDRLATRSAIAADHRALLQPMALSSTGNPTKTYEVTPIGRRPNVWHAPQLLTAAECLHIAQNAVDLLAPATVVDPATGRNVANPVRTSDGAVIGPMRETLVVQAINRRLAAISHTDVRQGEALAVLRYNPGQQFRPHLDSIAGAKNQRVKTVLVYLNDGFVGGATSFSNNGLSITPRAGDAIIFDNVREDGSVDPEARHAGEPIIRGTKWLATRWIRARPFDVWTGPEAS